jgi:zinc transporter ZupT
MDNENSRKVISNPRNNIYNTQARVQEIKRTRFIMRITAMVGAVVILVVTLLPLLVGGFFFPQNVLSLLTGFGAGMIVVIIPLIISEIKNTLP